MVTGAVTLADLKQARGMVIVDSGMNSHAFGLDTEGLLARGGFGQQAGPHQIVQARRKGRLRAFEESLKRSITSRSSAPWFLMLMMSPL